MSDPALDRLLSRALGTAPARDANDAIAAVRNEEGSELAEAVSYEVVVPPDDAGAFLMEKVLPRLVYFLECRGQRLPNCGGVVISLFVGETLYFLRCTDFVDELSALTGLSQAEMAKRYGG